MSQFIHDFVVGIDVASDFSYVAMLAPDGELIRKPFRIEHTPAGFQQLLQILKKEEERLNRSPVYFVESTGIFHLPLFFFLKSNGLKGFVLNPLCVHSTKNCNIRKVKNDKKDAEAIAFLAKYKDVKVSLVPAPQILSLRMFVREYFAFADNLTDCKLRFSNDLRLLFPGFKEAFSNPFSAAALAVLKAHPSVQSLQAADRDALAGTIAQVAKRDVTWAAKKLSKLLECSSIADSIGLSSPFLEEKIRIQVQAIQDIAESMSKLELAIRKLIEDASFPAGIRKNIELLEAMPGVGFLSAITLVAETGDFEKFPSAKALSAFFGVDPAVNESGHFQGNRVKMSKRGTRLGRRVLFVIAMASIRRARNGTAVNPILRSYYANKLLSKKKKVALVAVMHKLLHYIFAVIRDQTFFEFRAPEEHKALLLSKLHPVA